MARSRRALGVAVCAGLALWTAPGAALAQHCPPHDSPSPEPPGRHEHHEPPSRRDESSPFPSSPAPRPGYPSVRGTEAKVSVEFEKRPEAERGRGRVVAAVRVSPERGVVRRTGLTVTAPGRWVEFPRSCRAEGTRLSCRLGDLTGAAALRLGFREDKGEAGAGTRRRLTFVVESENAPRTVTAVRAPVAAPERPSWRGPGHEPRQERASRPERLPRQGAHRRSPARQTARVEAGRSQRAEVRRSPRALPSPAPQAEAWRSPRALPSSAPRALPSVESPVVIATRPPEPPVALPPIRPVEAAPPTQVLSMTSGAEPGGDDGRGWPAVLAVALAGEVALLWFAAAVALWRRRI